MDADATDETHLRRAVELSLLSLGGTSPNPNVGCVLVSPAGTVVGEGRTAPAGGPHAEVNALAAAGSAARGPPLTSPSNRATTRVAPAPALLR
ncbi:hypothetical protein GCM10027610_093060 [Dactylosporangium cerinum]